MKKLLVITLILSAIIAGVIVFLPKNCKHEYPDAYEVIRAASCTETGIQAKKCIHCGEYDSEEELEKLPHSVKQVSIIEATCLRTGVEQNVCADCDAILGVREVPLSGHVGGEDIIDKAASCTEDGEKHSVCIHCNEVLPTEIVKATGHLTENENWKVSTEPTCIATGLMLLHCDVCDAVVEDVEPKVIDAVGHQVENWELITQVDCETDGEQMGVCTVCGRDCFKLTGALGHLYTQWTSKPTGDWAASCPIVAPTCTEEGVEYRYCSNCQTIETRAVKALGHTAGSWVVDKEATCTATGVKHQACKTCSVTINTEIISTKAHTPGVWVVDTAATCLTVGEKHRNCTVCSKVVSNEVIPATGHNTSGEWVIDKAATCLDAGKKHKVCTVCKATASIEIIPAAGHKAGNWTVETAATCEKAGLQKQFCTVCKVELKSETTPVVAHTPGNWTVTVTPTCHSVGKTEVKCTKCNTSLESQTIPQTEHTYAVDSNLTVKATCTTTGKTVYVCTVKNCGATKEEIQEKTDHVISGSAQWTIVTPATCEQEGEKTVACSVCQSIAKTEVIPATGHKLSETTVNATCEADGSTTTRCTATGCEYSTTTAIPALGHSYAVQVKDKSTLVHTCSRQGCGSSYTESIPSISVALSVIRNEKLEGSVTTICMKEYLISAQGGYGDLTFEIAHYNGDKLVENITYVADQVVSMDYRISKGEKDLHQLIVKVKDTIGNEIVVTVSLATDALIQQ